MNIRLNKPYKIVADMHRKYDSHYSIPSSKCLIVPLKSFGEAASCDVRWQDDNGEMHVRHELMFSVSNLESLNKLSEFELSEIFDHYYHVAKQ